MVEAKLGGGLSSYGFRITAAITNPATTTTNEAAIAIRRPMPRTSGEPVSDACGNTSDKRAKASILSHIRAISSNSASFLGFARIQASSASASASDMPLSIFAIHALASAARRSESFRAWSSWTTLLTAGLRLIDLECLAPRLLFHKSSAPSNCKRHVFFNRALRQP